MKEKLITLLAEGSYDEAYVILKEGISGEIPAIREDPEYCILVANIFMKAGSYDAAFDVITMGLIKDKRNYELYLLLGEYYAKTNLKQALLCYKQAFFYCEDENDQDIILGMVDDVAGQIGDVPEVTIVIAPTRDKAALDRCIDSIKKTVPGYEYALVTPDTSINQGILKADPEDDIFVIDSSTVLTDNAFFYLMLALHSGENVGMVGGLTNGTGNINGEQGVNVDVSSEAAIEETARNLNSPMQNPYECKVFLSKFGMLINRKALDKAGLFDEEKFSGIYDDIDLSVRMNMAGFKVYLVYNSFVINHDYGAGRFTDEEKEKERKVLSDKWDCDLTYSSEARSTLIEMIQKDPKESFEVLELGCALGSSLNRIKFTWPNAQVHGVEYVAGAARIAGSIIDVIQGDVENMEIPYEKGQFDYVICADVLEHLRDPEAAIRRFLPYLKADGHFIVSLPNVRHYAVCQMLMQFGRFDYSDSGILDRTHLKFFTKATAVEMLENCGFEILEIKENYNGENQDNEFIRKLRETFDVVDADEMRVFQYYFLAGRKGNVGTGAASAGEASASGRGQSFNTLVVITPKDFDRLISLYPRLLANIGYGPVNFVGTDGVKEILEQHRDTMGSAGFVNEDSIIPFDQVHACMAKKMEPMLQGRELPRGITGWYYQQFLKMQYAFICKDEYYMVWDGDTIPCKEISMFSETTGKPYIDMKHEYHEEYFQTMAKLLPGFGKMVSRSFISEHMLIRTDIMRELIAAIESNGSIPGEKFWEKIINSIPVEKIQDSAFSEFETYGTFVAMKHPDVYDLRDWHSFRQGGTFYKVDTICDRDFNWLAHDFQAISFEKGHEVREDNAGLFDNPYYQEKLTPKQMLQAAQLEYREGYKEIWGDEPEADANNHSGAYSLADDIMPEDRLKYLNKDTYKDYEKLGDELLERNRQQAFLCYENAEYLCDDAAGKERLRIKKEELDGYGALGVKKTAIIILSFNTTYVLQRCIESIYTNCNPETCQLVIFDNGSTDGTQEWLARWGEDHDEAMIVLNETNLGFSGGNNAAYQYVTEDYDPFFLNDDTRVPANALFWLRMGLYSAEDIGGVGAMQNYAYADQLADIKFDRPELYVEHGAKSNVYMENPLEEQSKLCGFAFMFRREAFDKAGGFDEEFYPGFVEDDDLSLNVRSHGYRLVVCHNAFIYHAGSQSFGKRNDNNELFKAHREIVIRKWGFDSTLHGSMSTNEYAFVKSLKDKGYTEDSEFSLVHLEAGCGNMLARIHFLYPKAKLAGVEKDDAVRKFAVSCVDFYPSAEDLPMKLEDYDIVATGLG